MSRPYKNFNMTGNDAAAAAAYTYIYIYRKWIPLSPPRGRDKKWTLISQWNCFDGHFKFWNTQKFCLDVEMKMKKKLGILHDPYFQ